MTTSRPDDIRSSSAVSEDNNYSRINPDDEDEEDPIIRNIDVFISPELSRTLHLLQFPIQPANSSSKAATTTPIEAKLRPKHNMLELEYSIPNMALGGGHHAHHKNLPIDRCWNYHFYWVRIRYRSGWQSICAVIPSCW